jgi:hypothetical protein
MHVMQSMFDDVATRGEQKASEDKIPTIEGRVVVEDDGTICLRFDGNAMKAARRTYTDKKGNVKPSHAFKLSAIGFVGNTVLEIGTFGKSATLSWSARVAK